MTNQTNKKSPADDNPSVPRSSTKKKSHSFSKLIKKAFSSIQSQSNKKHTLFLACKKNRAWLIEKYLPLTTQKGRVISLAHPDLRIENKTLVHWAAVFNNWEILLELIRVTQEYNLLFFQAGEDLMTPLMEGIMNTPFLKGSNQDIAFKYIDSLNKAFYIIKLLLEKFVEQKPKVQLNGYNILSLAILPDVHERTVLHLLFTTLGGLKHSATHDDTTTNLSFDELIANIKQFSVDLLKRDKISGLTALGYGFRQSIVTNNFSYLLAKMLPELYLHPVLAANFFSDMVYSPNFITIWNAFYGTEYELFNLFQIAFTPNYNDEIKKEQIKCLRQIIRNYSYERNTCEIFKDIFFNYTNVQFIFENIPLEFLFSIKEVSSALIMNVANCINDKAYLDGIHVAIRNNNVLKLFQQLIYNYHTTDSNRYLIHFTSPQVKAFRANILRWMYFCILAMPSDDLMAAFNLVERFYRGQHNEDLINTIIKALKIKKSIPLEVVVKFVSVSKKVLLQEKFIELLIYKLNPSVEKNHIPEDIIMKCMDLLCLLEMAQGINSVINLIKQFYYPDIVNNFRTKTTFPTTTTHLFPQQNMPDTPPGSSRSAARMKGFK